jgi:putative tryptophan/tyrosine transport system substrate-binding protein
VSGIGRREFVILLGGGAAAAAWPIMARAQQAPMPVVGFLHAGSLAVNGRSVAAFHEGLAEAGYGNGRNVAIEFRWANNQLNQLPTLVADLVSLRPAVIVAAGALRSALEAKRATSTIPIVLAGAAFDPVKEGFVASFNRPGGNVTGLTVLNTELLGKRLELLSQMVPQATRVAFLAGPSNSLLFEEETSEVRHAAQALGREIIVLEGRTDSEFETAFDTLVHRGGGALLVGVFPWLNERRHKILALAAHHKIPAMYPFPAFAFEGGLMSYGVGRGVFREVAFHYVGQILKGAKPNNLPVQQPSKFELVINLKTARTLGIEVPDKLLAIADQVIE